MAVEFGSLTRPRTEPPDRPDENGDQINGFYLLHEVPLREVLEQEYRNISEILVHTLDYLYFYDSQSSIYVQSIWTSWAVVPGVVRDLRQYMLRTLLAVASTLTGAPLQRFNEAVEEVRKQLTAVEGKHTSASGLIRAAIDLLDSKEEAQLADLFPPFYAGLRLADLASKVVYSQKIRSELFDRDILADYDGDVPEYLLESGVFADLDVGSPVVFFTWRLLEALKDGDRDEELERTTAWALLAAS
jgi:hypothetical protein